MRSTIPERIDRLAVSEPMPLETVDFTVLDPERLNQELGQTFAYFGRVEGEVAADPLLVMMPRLGTEYGGYKSHGSDFISIWVAQEQAHGQIFDRLQVELGLEPLQPVAEITNLNRLAGALGKMSTSLHAVFEMIYLTRGAMHEKLTFDGYRLMADKLEALGETALLETMVKPIRTQESGHLGYYKHAAKELKGHLHPWQLGLARRLSLMTYAPVGAHTDADKAHFGHVAEALAGEQIADFAAPIQTVAEQLLNGPERPGLPQFVVRALQNSVEANRQLAA